MNISIRFLIVAALAMTGCQHPPRHPEARQAPWQVHRATQPIQIDGKLDEADWQKAPPIALGLPQPEQAKGRTLEEAGTARLLYDDHNLYVTFELEDADLVAEEQTGEPHLLRLGDVVEVFLKPADPLWYWEFHVNPVGKILTYGYPGRGRLGLPSTIGIPAFIQAAARYQGTLNNFKDQDRGWTAEIAIPLDKLYRYGKAPPPDRSWTIFLARYNYSAYRQQGPGPELSSAPVVAEVNFHLSEQYAPFELVR